MEKLGLYDANGIYINDFIFRNEKDTLLEGKYYKEIILFIIDNNKFLIQKSSIKKGDIFETLSGHVINGENSISTIIREANEELHINISKELIHFFKVYFYKSAIQEVYYIQMNINIEKIILQLDEVVSVNLYEKEKILKLIKEKKFRKKNIMPFVELIDYLNI